MTSAKQIFVGSRRCPALPYDAEVEYLESTGTQWILPDISPSTSVRFVGEIRPTTGHTSADTSFFGNYKLGAHRGTFIGWNANNWNSWHGPGTTWGIAQITGGTYYSVEFDDSLNGGRKFVVNGTTYTNGGKTTDLAYNSAYYVFAGGVNAAWMQLSKCQIYADGVLIRDFIPVRFTNELGQSEGAMYDRVSGQLFRNSGTGVFGFGTDIAGGGYKWLGYSPLRFSRFSRLWKEAA